MKKNTSLFPGYSKFLGKLKQRIALARIGALRSVNGEMIHLYWDIGKGIINKQKVYGWGDSVVETLARDLQKSFPSTKGFSSSNLWRMRQFYTAYSSHAFLVQLKREFKSSSGKHSILAQPVPEILTAVYWGHHVEILKKIKNPVVRLYYLKATAQFGWTRPVHERDMESRLLERLREFILELGYGFCFIGNQYRLTLGANEYFIDLLFYHRFLKALVAIELKMGRFEPEYAGKMDFYLNLLNEKEKTGDDRPSIGIILCAEKDNLEVEFSLKTKLNPIGVAEYNLVQKLPERLKGKLPNEQDLLEIMRSEMKTITGTKRINK